MTVSSPLKPAGEARSAPSSDPANAKMILATLIIVAAVANLPLAMANVALPAIGSAFDATQTQLNLVAVGYSLGLACSVLWLGALGDRYGRKQIALLGVALAIPAAIISGTAPTIQVLSRRAYWRLCRRHGLPDHAGPDRGAVGSRPGPHACHCLVGRGRRSYQRQRAVPFRAAADAIPLEFRLFVVLPIAVVAFIMAWKFIPAHVGETTEPVDNLGGILSLLMVGALILALNFAPLASADPALFGGLVLVTILALILLRHPPA